MTEPSEKFRVEFYDHERRVRELLTQHENLIRSELAMVTTTLHTILERLQPQPPWWRRLFGGGE